jgi:hypothetical protein
MAVKPNTAPSNHVNSTATKALLGAAEPDVPRAAYSIPEFCTAHRICEAFYYKLRAAGLGPREMRAGRKVTISIEAAEDWRRARENDPQATSTAAVHNELIRA